MQNGDVYVIGMGGFDGKNYEDAQTVQQVIGYMGTMEQMISELMDRIHALEEKLNC